MFHFIELKNKPKSKHKISIDLSECESQKDFVLRLSESLSGSQSPELQ